MTPEENLQVQQNLFDIYSGILFNNLEFASEIEKAEITYDFDCPEYKTLIEKYGIDEIAGKGTSFQRSERLLHWMSPKLTHKSNYDNHIPCNSLALLEYSLNNPDQGINCVNKAKILAECCLAVGIYARRVFIMPYSPYDSDSHVVTEIYDPKMGRWIMLDPSMDGYIIDENGQPLSVLAAREKFARQEPVSFAACEEEKADIKKLQNTHMADNAYYCKNLFRIAVNNYNGFGQDNNEALWLIPSGCSVKKTVLANVEYRMRLYPEEKAFYEKWLAQNQANPESVPYDISVLTDPPQ